MNSWLWAALAAVGGAALWYIMTMNRFARLLVKIRESDSGIEVALTRRFDTLTRMLDVTRAYARHEAGTLGSIVKMRQGMSMAQWSDANSQMDVLHGKINVLAEAYRGRYRFLSERDRRRTAGRTPHLQHECVAVQPDAGSLAGQHCGAPAWT